MADGQELAEKLYSLTEAAEEIGCERRRLMYLIRKKEAVNAQKVGWMYVLTESQVEKLKEDERQRQKESGQ